MATWSSHRCKPDAFAEIVSPWGSGLAEGRLPSAGHSHPGPGRQKPTSSPLHLLFSPVLSRPCSTCCARFCLSSLPSQPDCCFPRLLLLLLLSRLSFGLPSSFLYSCLSLPRVSPSASSQCSDPHLPMCSVWACFPVHPEPSILSREVRACRLDPAVRLAASVGNSDSCFLA